MRWRVAWLVWVPLAAATSSVARADGPPPPAQRSFVYSEYEEQTIDEVLRSLDLVRDRSPEGKTIEHIDVVPLDVIEPRDPLPTWINAFHSTSREAVIRRELLENVGEPYRQVLVDETLRNLRRLPQLSAVLVVAAVGSQPDRVVVVVITKDVWSLRLNWDAELTPGGVESFIAQPAEWNFLGTHQMLSGYFAYEPAAYTFGLGYVAPRIAASRIALQAAANVVVSRTSGRPEGSLGSLVAGQPIYSALTEWAWDASASWQDQILRRYTNAELAAYFDPATNRAVPYAYRARRYTTTYELTRSFGWETKHDFTFAVGIDRKESRPAYPGLDPRTESDFFASSVPVADTWVGPSVQYHTYSKRYVRVIDFDTLALQEDYRLGHDVVLRAYPSARALGGSRDVFGFAASFEYTFAVRDGLFRASVKSITEAEPTRIADALFQPTIHFVSPSIGRAGRLVVDGTFLYRWRNYLNQTTLLGGGDRLRGYPTSFFVGHNAVVYNAEFRTRPVDILTCEIGGVAFFDAGDAFNDARDFSVHQGAGVGLRALFPQLDRMVFRADLGFPFERPVYPGTAAPIAPYEFFISFEQAFSTPSVDPTPVLPTGQ